MSLALPSKLAVAFTLGFAVGFAFAFALAFALHLHVHLHLHLHLHLQLRLHFPVAFAFAVAFALAFALAFAFAKSKRSQNGPNTDPDGGKNQFELGRTGLDRTGWGRIRVGSDFGRLHVHGFCVPHQSRNYRDSPQTAAAQLQTLPIC